MSGDGSTIAITYSHKNIDVFLNNGSTFNVHQSIPSTSGFIQIAISGANSLYVGHVGVAKYSKDRNGNYGLITGKNTNKEIYDIDICNSEEYGGAATSTGPKYFTGSALDARSTSTFDALTLNISSIQFSYDCELVALVASDNTIRVYRNRPSLSQLQKIQMNMLPTDVAISSSYLVVSFSSYVLLYIFDGLEYVLNNKFADFNARKIATTSDLSVFVSGRTDSIFSVYSFNNNIYTIDFNYSVGMNILHSVLDENATLFAGITEKQHLYIFYKCPSFCLDCTFKNNCTLCASGYHVEGGYCVADTPTSNSISVIFCAGNKTIAEGVCEQFCHDKCQTCTDVWTECIECSEFYIKDDNGNCVIENGALSLATTARPIMNLLKGKAFTNLFFAISDLRFYSYHQKEYNGLEKQVFTAIRFIEEKQWELVGLGVTKDRIEGSVEFASKYYPESNPTYLIEERKGNLFIESTIDYFVFFVPFTLVTVVLLNRLFYCLFNY